MVSKERITGWRLDEDQRERLLALFPPRYPDTVADHVTLGRGQPLPQAAKAQIIGRADDEAGVEALVVKVDGTEVRPDGKVFHITWSLDRSKGREARDSNDVIAERGWSRLEAPFELDLTPGEWP